MCPHATHQLPLHGCVLPCTTAVYGFREMASTFGGGLLPTGSRDLFREGPLSAPALVRQRSCRALPSSPVHAAYGRGRLFSVFTHKHFLQPCQWLLSSAFTACEQHDQQTLQLWWCLPQRANRYHPADRSSSIWHRRRILSQFSTDATRDTMSPLKLTVPSTLSSTALCRLY